MNVAVVFHKYVLGVSLRAILFLVCSPHPSFAPEHNRTDSMQLSKQPLKNQPQTIWLTLLTRDKALLPLSLCAPAKNMRRTLFCGRAAHARARSGGWGGMMPGEVDKVVLL